MKPSLLYIPDISGFTKYVNETEIEHSQHVISGLLELIIDSNELDMTVSEIEGDAILFYKYRDVPAMHKLLSQVRGMFLNFHNHLKQFENDRICQCGACRSAVNLKLKIIMHSGELEFLNVKEHKKLFGSDLILAHRLLKNNIEENEYVLFSDNVFNETGEQDIKIFHDWAKVHSGKINYDELGDIEFTYIPLKPLHKHVALPPIGLIC